MNVRFALGELEFEWDSDKADQNVRKHGVYFETACEAFFDPFLQAVVDEEVEGEPREAVIGLTEDWQLLVVV